jgi:hypothetical protein
MALCHRDHFVFDAEFSIKARGGLIESSTGLYEI